MPRTPTPTHAFPFPPLATPAQASKLSREEQAELMQQAELRRRMRELVVPTNDVEVRRYLRRLGEPITLFGEREVRGFW